MACLNECHKQLTDGVPVAKPPESPTETDTTCTEFVGPRLTAEMQHERIREIGARLLLKCLLNVEWSDCTCRTGLTPGGITRSYCEEVLEAAREMKSAGIGWEQLC